MTSGGLSAPKSSAQSIAIGLSRIKMLALSRGDNSPQDYSALAQLVEQMTVNHWVAGSSPAGGATFLFPMPFMAALEDGR